MPNARGTVGADEDTWLEVLEVECLEGDLFSIDSEAIAVPVNVKLNLNYSLGRLLAQRGGTELARRIQSLLSSEPDGRIPLGTAVSVDTSDLPHLPARVILVAWWNEDTLYDGNHLYKSYASILREAFEHDVSSLALPILGGRGGVRPELRARVVCDLLRQFDRLRSSGAFSVTHLIFADVARSPLTAIEDELDRRLYAPL